MDESMKSKLIAIATHLRTESRGKKHGSYSVYRDDKIEISYDTYYPNVEVTIFIDGSRTTVAHYSGHGHTVEFHDGQWCRYVTDKLYPLALKAREDYETMLENKRLAEQNAKFGSIDDSSIFAN